MSPITPPVHKPVTHALLDLPGIRHGFFTRRGGVSEPPYESLNTGQGSRDAPEHVAENRRRVAEWFGQPETRLLSLYQVHSAKALAVSGPWPSDQPRPEADGLVTATPGLIVSALSADCAPLLFADPKTGQVAACHAGWRGALHGMIEATLNLMAAKGAVKGDIHAVVGPCISQASYEVSTDYQSTFLSHDADSRAFFASGRTPDKRQFDLPGYCLMRLRRAGVEICAATGHDTCLEAQTFFSNRRAFLEGESDYGRLISAIMIAPY